MLYLEEHQMNLDIRGYDMVTKQLVKKPNIFQLTVNFALFIHKRLVKFTNAPIKYFSRSIDLFLV